MAQYGKFEKTVLDSQGNPISGASVEIRRQGALVTSSQAGPTYTVNDPGGIIVTDTVGANLVATPTRAVTAVTSTTLTAGILGLGPLVNNDRITIVSPLPSLYADASGSETKTNPLTTDANGYVSCWLPIVPYDIKTSATGYGTRLETDVIPMGHGYVEINDVGGAGTTAIRTRMVRTLTGGRLQTWENPGGTIKAEIDYSGTLTLANALSVAGISTLTGAVSCGSTLAVTGALTASGLITASAGITSAAPFTYSGATGSFSLTAGSIETADVAANGVSVTTTGLGSADMTVAAAAGYASGNYQDVAGATVTITPFASTSELVVTGLVHTENNAGTYGGYAAIRSSGGTILSEAGITDGTSTSGLTTSTEFSHRVTGLTGSQTFKLSTQCTVGTAYDINDSTHAAKLRISRVIVVEHKK